MGSFDHFHLMKSLKRTWPEGIPVAKHVKPGEEPWPETQATIRGHVNAGGTFVWVEHDGNDEPENENGVVAQCEFCVHYRPVEGETGMDWGGCVNPASQYFRELVFEHWTCPKFRNERIEDMEGM